MSISGTRRMTRYISSHPNGRSTRHWIACFTIRAVILDRGSGFGYGGATGAYLKDRDYLLFVLEHVSDTSDYEQIEAALDKCERILDEMLNQVLEDKRKNRQWIAFSLEEVEADYVVNIDSQLYGVVAAIHLSQPYKAVNCRKAFN